jgi:hypothetical protein
VPSGWCCIRHNAQSHRRCKHSDGFIAILKADQEAALNCWNEDSKDVAPFVMTVSWAETYWLPQIPKVIFSSARAMRALKSAK